MTSKDLILSTARQFLAYVNKAPSPYHAVEEIKSKLVAAGFRELRDTDQWQVKPKDKCFVTKNQSTIIAFAVGGQFKPGNGFSIVGAHTDSPCLKRDHNEKFSPNKETNICPVLSTEVQSQLGKPVGETADTDKSTPTQADKHQPLLVKLLCDELKVEPEQLMDFDLHLADTQPAAIGGALEEFIFSPRLDNLLNAYTAAVDFVVRNDVACGSTIGPIMSAKLGMATVDIGAPQLSMHSIREMCCTTSVLQSQTLYQAMRGLHVSKCDSILDHPGDTINIASYT
ncbi:DNPEP-like protein [Mya arenaria]|uniref:aspartyl aminopeptidase n=1 Tax=Mya arenaria TaxID=6604 RepID=A0ABY7E3C4_MYAAR|nr:DNPEP-like protein [Mya arenaria]